MVITIYSNEQQTNSLFQVRLVEQRNIPRSDGLWGEFDAQLLENLYTIDDDNIVRIEFSHSCRGFHLRFHIRLSSPDNEMNSRLRPLALYDSNQH